MLSLAGMVLAALPLTIQVDLDNDTFLPQNISRDKYYTQGLRLGGFWTFDAHSSAGFSIGSSMYTPERITAQNIDQIRTASGARDRPFAGFSYGALVWRSSWPTWGLYGDIQVGLLGHWSGAGKLQQWWHGLCGYPSPTWVGQVGDDAAQDTPLQDQVVWQTHFRPEWQMGLDLPWLRTSVSLPVRAGQIFTSAGVGATARLGLLGAHPMMAPSPWPGVNARQARIPLLGIPVLGAIAFYAYFNVEARGVLWNATLQGVDDPSRNLYHVTPNRLVIDAEPGLVLAIPGAVLFRASIMIRSTEFQEKPWRVDDNAYVSMSVVFLGLDGQDRSDS